MIKKIRLVNFLSFKDHVIELNEDINILIGVNASGKSNFIKALQLLKAGLDRGLKKYIISLGGFANICFKQIYTGTKMIKLEFYLDGKAISRYAKTKNKKAFGFYDEIKYTIELTEIGSSYTVKELMAVGSFEYIKFDTGTGFLSEKEQDTHSEKSKAGKYKYTDKNPEELVLAEMNDFKIYPYQSTLRNALDSIAVYTYFDTTQNSAIRRGVSTSEDGHFLYANGSNLAQVLNNFQNNIDSTFERIKTWLKEINQNFKDISFLLSDNNLKLRLKEFGLEGTIDASALSDGTLRYLCLLAVFCNPKRGQIVCIDEPEVGLHPDMVANIAQMVKDIHENTNSTDTQSMVIISTHSEHFLDQFELEQAKIFEKDEENATIVKSYTMAQFEGWYEEYSLGKAWKNGDLGGVRYGG